MATLESFLKKIFADEDNLSSNECAMPDPIKTPSPGLNWALNGGIYPGGIYCFAGPPSGGKSFMALAAVSEMLKKDKTGVVFWFDAEATFSEHFRDIFLPDPEDRKRLIIRRSVPMTGSSIFDYFKDTILGMVNDGMNLLACVVDSVGAFLCPKESGAKSTENFIMGDLAAYLPKALRLISGPSKPRLKQGFNGITWIFISQVRDNFDPNAQYSGEKYTIPGGKAFAHFADAQIIFEKIQSKKTGAFNEDQKNMNDSSVQIGHRVRAKVQKHKLGPPSRVAEFDIIYDHGVVNQEAEIASLGIKLGILTKDGNTYYFGDRKIAVGEAKAVETISADKELYDQIAARVMSQSNDEKINPKILIGEAEDADSDR